MPESISITQQQWMRERLVNEDRMLRAMAIPYIAKGYRIEELHMLIHEHRFLTPTKDYFGLEPRIHHPKSVLFLRRCWRRFFPYRIPRPR